jgi:protoporphyrinogen oxidase
LRCVASYAWAKPHPVKQPTSLEDWVTNQFGHRLFSIFFKSYTEKVWGIGTKELSADWAAQRIKGLSLLAAAKSALLPRRAARDADSAIIKTLIDQFRYSRLGPGQLWERVAGLLDSEGYPVLMGHEVARICHDGRRVMSVIVRDRQTGQEREIVGDEFISTLPMRELVASSDPALPPHVVAAANALSYRDFLTVALVIKRADVFPDNWIYIHDPRAVVGRIQNFKNWSPEMVPDPNTTCLGMEYFCFEGDGLWTSSNEELVRLAVRDLALLGLCKPDEVAWGAVVRQRKAYPVYDDAFKANVTVIRDHPAETMPNLHLVGRNGMHHYNNQDHSMMTALLVARNIANGTTYDQWKVNTDAEYHEEARVEDEDGSGRRVPMRVPAA